MRLHSNCSVLGCNRPLKYSTLGFCDTHYASWRRTGTALPIRPTPEERFWSKVDKVSDGCWNWVAGQSTTGYGTFRVGSLTDNSRCHVYVHRFSYELHHGPIPAGLQVNHRCDNRLCVNPAHLMLGTAKDNTADCIAKGRFPHGEVLATYANAKITQAIADEMRVRWLSQGHRCYIRGRWIDQGCLTHRSLGQLYGLSESGTVHVLNGDTWNPKLPVLEMTVTQ